MPARFDADFGKLKEDLLRMGALAERMLRNLGAVLIEGSGRALADIYSDEAEMDHLQVEVDEEAIRMIGVYTPVAADLRRLLMITRMNADIERMGDKAVDIGHIFEDYLQGKDVKSMADFRPSLELVQAMVAGCLNAFVEGSETRAMSVISMDDKVDSMTKQMTRALFTHMLDDARAIGQIFGLIQVAQSLERIADHAVNICEDVVYIVKGKDIRHLEEPEAGSNE
jgi:phosphate transport system protein